MDPQEFTEFLNNLRETLPEDVRPNVSEPFTELIGHYSAEVERAKEAIAKAEKLENQNKDLLISNGKLYKQITERQEKQKPTTPYDDNEEDDILKNMTYENLFKDGCKFTT